jgi:hypothetical protein
MAALADVTGGGRALIAEVADSLRKEGLLEPDASFETVDQMLDGLERSASQLAETINTPPLDVRGMREEWKQIQRNLAAIPPKDLPSIDRITRAWAQLKTEAARQERSVFEISTALAVGALARLPEQLWWLSRCAQNAALCTTDFFAGTLFDHYSQALGEMRKRGFLDYWAGELRPYFRAAATQFSTRRLSATERLLRRYERAEG